MNGTLYLNTRFLPAAEARVSALDAGMLFGAGIFETLLARGGVPFYFERHYARLRAGCAELGVPLAFGQAALRDVMLELLRRNGLEEQEARLKVLVTPGDTARHISHRDSTVLVTAEPYLRPSLRIPWKLLCDGAVMATPASRLKSTSYVPYRMVLHAARAGGYDDAILLDRHGHVSETSIASLLLFADGGLVLPLSADALPGITREVVAGIAASRGMVVEERPVTVEELISGSSVCVCNALLGPFPVGRINETALPRTDPDLLAALRQSWESGATGTGPSPGSAPGNP